MTQIDKLNLLLKQDQKLFHTQDLAILWSIKNRDTLYTTIKRLLKREVLIKVQKGLYSTLALDQIDPKELALAISHKFCYLSTESVLANEGIISQRVYPHTFVSTFSKKKKIADNLFIFRKLQEKYLYQGKGIYKINNTFAAEKERAVADMLYFNPKYYFDNPDLINWKRVKEIQEKVGY